VSRSSLRGWTSKRFSRGRNAHAGFVRNAEILCRPVFAATVFSNDGLESVVVGCAAGTQFVRMNIDFPEEVVAPTEVYGLREEQGSCGW